MVRAANMDLEGCGVRHCCPLHVWHPACLKLETEAANFALEDNFFI